MDYVYVIYHIPLYSAHFMLSVWGILYNLPWPPGAQVFGSICIFILLYPVRILMGALFPEKVYASKVRKRVYKRRSPVPTAAEHQAATALSVGSIIHHF